MSHNSFMDTDTTEGRTGECCRPHPIEASAPQPDTEIVRQGWLGKRDDLARVWKDGYFILWNDGRFLGYLNEPADPPPEPHQNFFIKHCRITACKQIRKSDTFKFRIQGAHFTTFFSWKFCATSELERALWLEALTRVEEEVTYRMCAPPREVVRAAARKDFDNFRMIGEGSFGKVELCREKSTGKLFALKTVSKLGISKDSDVTVLSEKQILSTNKHPFLMELKCCFEQDVNVSFVMEYANGGDLASYIKRKKNLSQQVTCFYAAQVTAAIGYLHSHCCIYRDLKPENILITSDGYLKLADFGLAKNVEDSDATAHAMCGTAAYVAPEVVDSRDYGRAVDWWALGIVVFEMLTGQKPFKGTATVTLGAAIQTHPVVYPPYVTEMARSFMSALLQKNPLNRLGSSRDDYIEVESHHFFAEMDWTSLLEKKISPFFVPEVSTDDDTRYFRDV